MPGVVENVYFVCKLQNCENNDFRSRVFFSDHIDFRLWFYSLFQRKLVCNANVMIDDRLENILTTKNGIFCLNT